MSCGIAGEEVGPKAFPPIIEWIDEAVEADENGDWWGTTAEFFELECSPCCPESECEADAPSRNGWEH